jgi:hypothetical protein
VPKQHNDWHDWNEWHHWNDENNRRDDWNDWEHRKHWNDWNDWEHRKHWNHWKYWAVGCSPRRHTKRQCAECRRHSCHRFRLPLRSFRSSSCRARLCEGPQDCVNYVFWPIVAGFMKLLTRSTAYVKLCRCVTVPKLIEPRVWCQRRSVNCLRSCCSRNAVLPWRSCSRNDGKLCPDPGYTPTALPLGPLPR